MKRLFLIISALFALGLYSYAQNNSNLQTSTNEAWSKFTNLLNDANCEFAKGAIGESTRAVWSHGDDVTLFA